MMAIEGSGVELADYEPSTSHFHGCSEAACRCIHHLYAIAQDAEARLAAVEALADVWAADPDGLPRADGCSRQVKAALHPDPSDRP